MRDAGNDAMMAAADRFYNADPTLRDEEGNPLCSHCERNPVRDESEAVFASYEYRGCDQEGGICLECASGIFEEELDDLAEGVKLFANVFAPSPAFKIAAE